MGEKCKNPHKKRLHVHTRTHNINISVKMGNKERETGENFRGRVFFSYSELHNRTIVNYVIG